MLNDYVHTAEGTPAMLCDGSTVLIRQVRGIDAPLLADGFARLSARSRQLRFLGPKKMLSAAELRYLTDVEEQDDLNRVWARYLGGHLPTTTTVEVSRLATHRRCKLEISAIAVTDDNS